MKKMIKASGVRILAILLMSVIAVPMNLFATAGASVGELRFGMSHHESVRSTPGTSSYVDVKISTTSNVPTGWSNLVLRLYHDPNVLELVTPMPVPVHFWTPSGEFTSLENRVVGGNYTTSAITIGTPPTGTTLPGFLPENQRRIAAISDPTQSAQGKPNYRMKRTMLTFLIPSEFTGIHTPRIGNEFYTIVRFRVLENAPIGRSEIRWEIHDAAVRLGEGNWQNVSTATPASADYGSVTVLGQGQPNRPGDGGGGGNNNTPEIPGPTPATRDMQPATKNNLTIPMSQWHQAYLLGFADGEVRPEQNITRAEVATIFFRLLDDDYRVKAWETQNKFSDVNEGEWFNNAVSTMTNAGILNGRYDGLFVPDDQITRGEFAAVAARFTDSTFEGENVFSDTQGHWAENYINISNERGWVRGNGDGTFRPENHITRAEVATIINRMLNRKIESADDLLEGMKTWSDNADPNVWYYLDIQQATNSVDYERKPDGVHIKWVNFWPHFEFSVLESPGARATDIFAARAIWQQTKMSLGVL
jgi:hypothetical protein